MKHESLESILIWILCLTERIKWFKVDIIEGRLGYTMENLSFSPSYMLFNSILKHFLTGLLSLEYFCSSEIEQVLTADFVVEVKIEDLIQSLTWFKS